MFCNYERTIKTPCNNSQKENYQKDFNKLCTRKLLSGFYKNFGAWKMKKKIIFSLEVFKEDDGNYKDHYEIDTSGDSEMTDNLFICYLLEMLHLEILQKDVKKYTKAMSW